MEIGCEKHLSELKQAFHTMIDDKYYRGQIEHSGSLWYKSGLLDMAVEESLDLFTYQFTLQQQTLMTVEKLFEAIKYKDWALAMEALNILKFGNPEGRKEEDR